MQQHEKRSSLLTNIIKLKNVSSFCSVELTYSIMGTRVLWFRSVSTFFNLELVQNPHQIKMDTLNNGLIFISHVCVYKQILLGELLTSKIQAESWRKRLFDASFEHLLSSF